jgi:hypothetical protein
MAARWVDEGSSRHKRHGAPAILRAQLSHLGVRSFRLGLSTRSVFSPTSVCSALAMSLMKYAVESAQSVACTVDLPCLCPHVILECHHVAHLPGQGSAAGAAAGAAAAVAAGVGAGSSVIGWSMIRRTVVGWPSRWRSICRAGWNGQRRTWRRCLRTGASASSPRQCMRAAIVRGDCHSCTSLRCAKGFNCVSETV